MYFFFFKTMQVDRGKGKPEPTLRALPGQRFPDGTPVDTSLNVSAPKEPGTSPNGCRLEYPDGTVFCSSFLGLVDSGKPFYTVYDSSKGQGVGKAAPDFHPVTDNPNSFNYVSPSHRSDPMNAAYVSFVSFGDQGAADGDDDGLAVPGEGEPERGTRVRPVERGNKARPRIEGWKPVYEDQVSTESELMATWMRKVLNDLGVTTMARRPKVDSRTAPVLAELLECGETPETIASRTRLAAVMTEQKTDVQGLRIISQGPFEWYLDQILQEHRKGTDCTAAPRDVDQPVELSDAAFIINNEINRQNGTSEPYDNPAALADLKKAMKAGWTMDDILDPRYLLSAPSFASLASSLASGVIPLPESRTGAGGATLLDSLLSNPSLRQPTAKEGFHVDELVWNTLLVNVTAKINTLITGPTGTGKTEIVRILCERTNNNFTIIPMGSITDPTEQLVGKMDLVPTGNGNVETKYDWADFALAVQKPGVVLLDEVNRVPRNGFNILFSVLDGTRKLVAFGAKGTDKRIIDVHPDCVFFATANIGYSGTEELDPAFRNRFLEVEMDYLPETLEAQVLVKRHHIPKDDARNIAIIAATIRKAAANGELSRGVSTRETLQCARYVSIGFSVEQALEITFLPCFERGLTANDPSGERGSVRAMIAGRFNKKQKTAA